MKKNIFFFLVLCLPFSGLWACDVCSQASGSTNMEWSYFSAYKSFSYRYKTAHLLGHLGLSGVASPLTTNQVYQWNEFFYQQSVGKNFKLMVNVPFLKIDEYNAASNRTTKGLSDISIYGMVQLLKTKIAVHQSLWAGVGVVLPTGKYQAKNLVSSNSANTFQLGKGGTGFNLLCTYVLNIRKLDLLAQASYAINSPNKDNYLYGNKLTGNIQVGYRLLGLKKIGIGPFVGGQYEIMRKDNDGGFQIKNSGGYSWVNQYGIMLRVFAFNISAFYEAPLMQNIANQTLYFKEKYGVSLSYNIKKAKKIKR